MYTDMAKPPVKRPENSNVMLYAGVLLKWNQAYAVPACGYNAAAEPVTVLTNGCVNYSCKASTTKQVILH